MADFNDVFDDINEQRKYSRAGFSKGYQMGEEAGWREGFLFGMKQGASIATEIGFYQGYTTAWLTLLEKQDQGKARKVQALKGLLDMAKTFPIEEQLLSSTPIIDGDVGGTMNGRLAKIRSKFRHVQNIVQDARSPMSSAQPSHWTQQGILRSRSPSFGFNKDSSIDSRLSDGNPGNEMSF